MAWKLIETTGPNPGAISHHTSVVYNERMYLFGGSKMSGEENKNFYGLDLKLFKWEIIPGVRILLFKVYIYREELIYQKVEMNIQL